MLYEPVKTIKNENKKNPNILLFQKANFGIYKKSVNLPVQYGLVP